MSEHKDMTIGEIEEVLKDYTCEFEHGEKNYYLDYLPDFCFIVKETKYDYTQKKYFESEEKINSFIEKVGNKNAKSYYSYLNKDLMKGDEIYEEGFLSECRFIEDKIKQYIIKSDKEKYGVYIIRPYKENGKYVIKYIKLDRFKDSLLGDGCFETLEDAERAVKEIGEYNILHYLFYIKDSVLKESVKNESDTTQKDMVKNPSHYQGKYGLEVYDVLENFLEDVESYYVGNIIKYILRYKNKNGLEDIKKAREYIDKLIELEEK